VWRQAWCIGPVAVTTENHASCPEILNRKTMGVKFKGTTIGGRHGSLEEEGASDIVGSANHALSFSVLLRSIGAGHAKGNTFGEK